MAQTAEIFYFFYFFYPSTSRRSAAPHPVYTQEVDVTKSEFCFIVKYSRIVSSFLTENCVTFPPFITYEYLQLLFRLLYTNIRIEFNGKIGIQLYHRNCIADYHLKRIFKF